MINMELPALGRKVLSRSGVFPNYSSEGSLVYSTPRTQEADVEAQRSEKSESWALCFALRASNYR